MRAHIKTFISATAAALTLIFILGGALTRIQGQSAAVPGQKGGQDFSGAYEVVPDWPKPLHTLPGHEQWSWSCVMSVFAESPNRVFVLQRGELPRLPDPPARGRGRGDAGEGRGAGAPGGPPGAVAGAPPAGAPGGRAAGAPGRGAGGPIPVPGAPVPRRNAQQSSPPDNQNLTAGVDYRWEHVIMVVDANGTPIETEAWKQWDSLFIRPHSIAISPYDPEKHVWIVDDAMQVVYKFTNDGKKLVQTLGTPKVMGNDDKTFNRPTFLAWLPDGTTFVADGYNNTRVVKFDKDGKYLMAWGMRGTPGAANGPGYMNNVHGIAVDPQTRRVFVNDRGNGRVQVFDENGKSLDQWSYGGPPAETHLFILPTDRNLWVADRTTERITKYDLNGIFLYQFGTAGSFPGGFWGIHGMSTDQEGNLYIAEVYAGRVQKFRPRKGANPEYLLGKPYRVAWK